VTSPHAQRLLAHGRTELDAAHVLIEGGFSGQAIVHAYYATFFAAEAALLALGETRSKHSGVISAFGQLVVKAGGFDAAVAATLRKLFELRNKAVDDEADIDDDSASAAIGQAELFFAAVEAWLKTH
jgi:uncharacterized protein (UPF0332 family)